nr:hypothetical protein [Tanacetum cinerariifolium]
MSTQQDIYAAGSESRPFMLNKENYVPWSSRLLRCAKSKPNGKLIHNSILNGPYVRKMIPEPGDANRDITVTKTFHLQTDDELSNKELKQIEVDDQAVQTILLGSDIGIQKKKAKLFNEWERFTSNEGELIESYYHRFLKLMNDLKRNKHFPEKIASNLKFLNNLQRMDEFEIRFEEAQDDRALLIARVNTLFKDRPDHRRTAMLMDKEAMYAREVWAFSMDRSSAIAAHVRTLETQVAALIAQTSSLQTQLTTTLERIEILEARDPEPQEGPTEAGISSSIALGLYFHFVSLYGTCYNLRLSYMVINKMAPKKRTKRVTPATTTTPTTTITDAQLQALNDRGVAVALLERDADMSRNGDNNNDSGTGGRRQMTTPRECTYTDFLNCQPMSFQGTKGVVVLTRWLEKMKSVFQITNCTVACQVKFASCTLQGSALTWWNSHMRAVRHDVAYEMPWAALKRMITDKYCPRMFPKESAKVERYIGGLPNMIHGSVKASKPQSMQEAIEFATKMMDKKMLTHAERQAKHKRKFDDTSRNNQHQ